MTRMMMMSTMMVMSMIMMTLVSGGQRAQVGVSQWAVCSFCRPPIHGHRSQDCLSVIIRMIIVITIIIIITRPKPAYGRQGLAGSWGQDTDEVSTFLVFLTSHFAPAALSPDLKPTWDDKNPLGIMKTRPGAIKRPETMKNRPVTIKIDLELRFTLKTHLEPRKTNLKP